MRTICAYTYHHPLTVAGLPDDAEWHYVGDDDAAYWRLMRQVWADGESFTVIEHDVVARPDVFEQFEACECQWATFGYHDICCQDETGYSPCMEAWRNALGATRFRKELMAAVPDAVSAIPEQHRGWRNLCDAIASNLRAPGDLRPHEPHLKSTNFDGPFFTHHWHFPAVEHHHGSLVGLEHLIGG